MFATQILKVILFLDVKFANNDFNGTPQNSSMNLWAPLTFLCLVFTLLHTEFMSQQ